VAGTGDRSKERRETMRFVVATAGAVGLSLLVFLGVAILALGLDAAAQDPEAIVVLGVQGTVGALAYVFSKRLWQSRRPWLWAIATFALGLPAVGAFFWCWLYGKGRTA